MNIFITCYHRVSVMKSEALILDDTGSISKHDIDVPDIDSGEILVRIELTGICGSDVKMRHGGFDLDYPVVPGHELAGVIEQIGSDIETDSQGNHISEGDGVTVVPGINATEDWYTSHLPARPLACSDRKVYGFRGLSDYPHAHGGMSQYFIIEEGAYFYRLPDGLDLELGALVEPIAVASHALDLAYQPGLPWIREGFGIGQSVVVQGAGPIGILTGMTARAAGAGQVIMIDLIDERLEFAKEFGATHTVNASNYDGEEFIEVVREATPAGVGPDVVIEAVGHPSAFEQAMDIVRTAGTVVELGHYGYNGEAKIDPSQLIHKELKIHGSLAYPPTQFEAAISLLENKTGEVPFADMFNYRVGLDEAIAAYDAQENREAYRATIHPWE